MYLVTSGCIMGCGSWRWCGCVLRLLLRSKVELFSFRCDFWGHDSDMSGSVTAALKRKEPRFLTGASGSGLFFNKRTVHPERWVLCWGLWPSSAAWGSGTLSRQVADSGGQRLDLDAPPSPPSPWSEGYYSLLKRTQPQQRYSTKTHGKRISKYTSSCPPSIATL